MLGLTLERYSQAIPEASKVPQFGSLASDALTRKFPSRHVAAPELFQKAGLVQIVGEAVIKQVGRILRDFGTGFSGDVHRLGHCIDRYNESPINKFLRICVVR